LVRVVSTDWPTDYQYELDGEAENSGNATVVEKLPIAGMIVLLLLVGQFNFIKGPLIILTTVPLGVIGLVVGLLLANSSFGFFTILGILSLAGIINSNAIVLIDHIKIEIEELGRAAHIAVVAACQQSLDRITDHCNDGTRHDATLVGSNSYVQTNGGLDYLWTGLCDHHYPFSCPCFIQTIF
jgi:multidrug efflux pump subunit AcrB